ncbi:MAG: hypothetical protein II922_06905 [Succinimonas sp.]|nr:hypothetical protein [Succinimonas sp.]
MGKKLIGKKSVQEISGAINRLADSFFALADSIRGLRSGAAGAPQAASGTERKVSEQENSPTPKRDPEAGEMFSPETVSEPAALKDLLENLIPGAVSASPGVPAPEPLPAELPQAPAPDATETRCGEALQAFMRDKGFVITRIDNIVNESPIWVKLARTIGSDYHSLLPIINPLKVSQSRGSRIVVNLSRYAPEMRNACISFAKALYDNALLVEYRYSSGPVPTLTMRVQKDGAIINFITGHWMEIYVYSVAREVLQNYAGLYDIEVESYSNIQFMMNEKMVFELDILCFVNSIPVWVECKTGEFQQHIVKYKKFGSSNGIAPENSFLVLAGVSPEQAKNISDIHSYNVVNLNNFREVFSRAVAGICLKAGRKGAPLPEKTPETAVPAVSAPEALPAPAAQASPEAPAESASQNVPAPDAAPAPAPARSSASGKPMSRNRGIFDKMMTVINSARPVKTSETAGKSAAESHGSSATLSSPLLYEIPERPFLNEAVQKFMDEHGVQCICNTPITRMHIHLDILSRMKSGKYNLAQPLFRRIGQALKTGDYEVTESLAGCDGVAVGTTVQLCRHMADNMEVIRNFEYFSTRKKTVKFELLPNAVFNNYVLEDRRFVHAVGYVVDTAGANAAPDVFGVSVKARLCKGDIRIDADFLVRFRNIITLIMVSPANPERAESQLVLAGKWLDIPARNLIIVHNVTEMPESLAKVASRKAVTVLSHSEFEKKAREILRTQELPESPQPAAAARPTIMDLQFTPEELYESFSPSGIGIAEVELISQALSALDGAASEFCRHESLFQPLVQAVRRIHESHVPHERFCWNVNTLDGEKTSSINNCCTNLYRTDLIKECRYDKTIPKQFIIDLTDNQDIYSFVTGDWLRYFAGNRAVKYLGQHVRDSRFVRFIRNVTLEIPDAGTAVLDVVVRHPLGWTAVKSCSADNFRLRKEDLLKAGNALGIPQERLILVFRNSDSTEEAIRECGAAVRILKAQEFLNALPEIFPNEVINAVMKEEEPVPESPAAATAPAEESKTAPASGEEAPANREIPEFAREAAAGTPCPEILEEIIAEAMEEAAENQEALKEATGTETPEPAEKPAGEPSAGTDAGAESGSSPAPSASAESPAAAPAAPSPQPLPEKTTPMGKLVTAYYQQLMREAESKAAIDDFLEAHLMRPEECADFFDDERARVVGSLKSYHGKPEILDRLSLDVLADYCRNQEYAVIFNMLLEALFQELTSFALDMDADDETVSRYQKLLNDMVDCTLVYKNIYIKEARESRVTVLKPMVLRDYIMGGWFRAAGSAIIQNRIREMTIRHPECFCLFARNMEILLDNYRIMADLVIRTMNRVLFFVFAATEPEAGARDLAMLTEYLNLYSQDTVLVCLNEDPDLHERLAETYHVTVIGFNSLAEFLDSRLTPEYLETPVTEEDEDKEPDDQDAETVLQKFGYCPGLFDYMRYEF